MGLRGLHLPPLITTLSPASEANPDRLDSAKKDADCAAFDRFISISNREADKKSRTVCTTASHLRQQQELGAETIGPARPEEPGPSLPGPSLPGPSLPGPETSDPASDYRRFVVGPIPDERITAQRLERTDVAQRSVDDYHRTAGDNWELEGDWKLENDVSGLTGGSDDSSSDLRTGIYVEELESSASYGEPIGEGRSEVELWDSAKRTRDPGGGDGVSGGIRVKVMAQDTCLEPKTTVAAAAAGMRGSLPAVDGCVDENLIPITFYDSTTAPNAMSIEEGPILTNHSAGNHDNRNGSSCTSPPSADAPSHVSASTRHQDRVILSSGKVDRMETEKNNGDGKVRTKDDEDTEDGGKDKDADGKDTVNDYDEEIVENLRRIATRFSYVGDGKTEKSSGREEENDATSEGSRIQRLMDKIAELENVSSKLTREKTALVELMVVKNAELQEERQHSGSRILELEDETQRLRVEKVRLVDLFKLPESDRASMRALENELEEMRKRLAENDSRCCHLATENDELRREVKDLELEMQELHDQFQQEESLELRELRKELENTARDIRLLHFKLRKAERRNDELKNECEDYEEKMRQLEERGKSSEEEWKRTRILEEELRTAKEVSIQMHDECQRMERERKKMEKEMDELRQKMEAGKEPPVTSEAGGRGTNTFVSQKSFESGSTLIKMLEPVAEAAKKMPVVADADLCLNICRDLAKLLEESAESKKHMAPPSDDRKNVDIAKCMPGKASEEAKEQEEDERRERENEMRLQLALADEESRILRRKLTEMRNDNENLMRAVEYLRKKVEQSDVKDSPPTRHLTAAADKEEQSAKLNQGAPSKDSQTENNREQLEHLEKHILNPAEEKSGKAGTLEDNQGNEDHLKERKLTGSGCGIDERRRSLVEDDVVKTLGKPGNIPPSDGCLQLKGGKLQLQATSSGNDSIGGNGRAAGAVDESQVIRWKSRTLELQNEIVLLTEELQTTSEENERLAKEVSISRREVENMLETLRRKERQFGEERKVLKRRNNDLSKMFDLLTQRTKTRRVQGQSQDEEEDEEDEAKAVEGRRKRRSVDGTTQTEKFHPAIPEERPPQSDMEKIEKEKDDLELYLKAKDDVIRSKEEVIKRKDFLLGRAVKSIQDLETSIEDKIGALVGKEKELTRMEEELERWKERVDMLEKESRKMEEKLKKMDAAVKKNDIALEKAMEKISSTETELQVGRNKCKSLEGLLHVKESEVRSLRAERQKLTADLDKARVEIQQLEMDRNELLRQKKQIVVEAIKEKERLEVELEKTSTEKKLAQKEKLEVEMKLKRSEERWMAEKESSQAKLKMAEERLRTSGWSKKMEQDEVKATKLHPYLERDKSKIQASVSMSTVVQIPVYHEGTSRSPAPPSSASATAAAVASAAAAAAAVVETDVEAETRTGTGRDLSVHSTQRYRTTEALNPVVTVDQSSETSRSRLVGWSSSSDHRTRHNQRTASVDRYASTHMVPVSRTTELMSFQSLLPDSSAGSQLAQLKGTRSPTEESAATTRDAGNDVESRDLENGANCQQLQPGVGKELSISLSQPQELVSESADFVTPATPKFRRPEKSFEDASATTQTEFRRRSRSMSEFDVFSVADPDEFHLVQPPHPPGTIPNASSSVIPPSTSTVGSASADAASPSHLEKLAPGTSTDQSTSSGVVLRQKRTPVTGSNFRGSFYTSGTLSASASRATSPVRYDPPRRITPYPVPPPSMIISPARTPIRCPSADRSGRTFSQGDAELLRRKLEVVKTEVLSSTWRPIGIQLTPLESVEGFVRSNDFYHSWNRSKMERKEKMEKRSVSVSPRTARRKFFDEYPYDPPRDKQNLDRWRRKGGNEATVKLGQEVLSGNENSAKEMMTSAAGTAPPLKADLPFRRISLLNFSTLPFFRKKAPDSEPQGGTHQPNASRLLPVAVATSGESSRQTRTLPRLQMPKFSSVSGSSSRKSPSQHQESFQVVSGASESLSSGQGQGIKEPMDSEELKEGKESRESGKATESLQSREQRELKEPMQRKGHIQFRESEKHIKEPIKESRVSVESKEPSEPRESKHPSRESIPFGFGLQGRPQVPTSTQSLHEDQSNSLKFQKLIRPFRRLGSAGGVGAHQGRAEEGAEGGKQNSRVLYPAFQSLNESTIRSISLSSELMKELNIGYGHSRVTAESNDEGGLEDRRSKSLSNKMVAADSVKFRSLDRKKKSFF